MPCLAASADVDHPKSPKPPPRIGFSTMLCQAKFMPTTQQCRGPTQISPRNIPQKSVLGNPDKPGAGSRIGDGRRSAAFSATKPGGTADDHGLQSPLQRQGRTGAAQ